MVETLAKFRERLDCLTARVEGGDFSGLTPSEVPQMVEPSRDWCDRYLNERLEDYCILTWPDEDLMEEPSAQPLVNVSESTATTIRVAFRRLLSRVVGKGAFFKIIFFIQL